MLRDYAEINGYEPFSYVDFMEQTELDSYMNMLLQN